MTTTDAPTRETYRELGLLAEGGMALVVRAVRDSDGKDVVIKRIRPPLCFDQAFVRLFHDEGTLHGALSHEHIVCLLDSGDDDQGAYLVFEHVAGTDLSLLLYRAMHDGVPLDTELVLAIAIPIAKALAFVHEAHKDGEHLHAVHRDISPANVLLCEDGGVKLADFGVAASTLKTDVTQAGELKGKFAYMAPEQTRGAQATPAADLFALGVVLWECLANSRLFDAPTDADVVHQVRHAHAARLDDDAVRGPAIGKELADLTAQLLEKDPDKRPASARDVCDRLDAIALSRGLDEGLRLYVSRAVRTAPARELSPMAPDVPRRRTQRVMLATAETIRKRPTPRRRGLIAAGGLATFVATASIAAALWTRATPVVLELDDPSAPAPVALHMPPPTPSPAPPPVVPPPEIVVGADVLPKKIGATGRPRTPPPPMPTPTPTPIVEGFGKLSITSEPWARVLVDGVEAAKETPLVGLTLKAGTHEIVLENPVVGLRRSLSVTIGKDEHVRRFVDLQR